MRAKSYTFIGPDGVEYDADRNPVTQQQESKMTDRTLTGEQQDQLETLVDACGLDLVLGSLANICAAKSDHVLTNWQDRALANAWMQAMTCLDNVSETPRIKAVSD